MKYTIHFLDLFSFSNAAITTSATFDFSKFHPYSEIKRALSEWQWQFSGLATVTHMFDADGTVVKTHEGNTIRMLQIKKPGNFTKPKVYIDGGLHGREWISVAVAMFIASFLLDGYGTDAAATDLVDKFDWFIVPVVNPDGYEYTWTDDRMWRKNKRKNGDAGILCDGVDLNRNFGWFWQEEVMSSQNPCAPIYGGPHAFSEPETRALRHAILLIQPTLLITLHSYSQVLSYPFGHRRGEHAGNRDQLEIVASAAVEAMKQRYGTVYRSGNAAELLYPASGKFIDWAKGIAGVRFPFVFELPPTNQGQAFEGFIIPDSHINPISMEVLDAIHAMTFQIMQF